jgi:hypothetical protein
MCEEVEIQVSAACERVKAIRAKHQRSLCLPGSELEVHSAVRESHNTSKRRYRCPAFQVADD